MEVMMIARNILTLIALLAAVTAPVQGHHSFAAEFDANQPVTLRGTLTKLDWVNPHGWIFIDVKTAAGMVERWEIETAGTTQLMRRGLRRDDFSLGAELVVTGFRSRKHPHVAAARSVKKPDGTEFFLSSQGT